MKITPGVRHRHRAARHDLCRSGALCGQRCCCWSAAPAVETGGRSVRTSTEPESRWRSLDVVLHNIITDDVEELYGGHDRRRGMKNSWGRPPSVITNVSRHLDGVVARSVQRVVHREGDDPARNPGRVRHDVSELAAMGVWLCW